MNGRSIGGRFGGLLAVVMAVGVLAGPCVAPLPAPPGPQSPVPAAPVAAQVMTPTTATTVLGSDDPAALAVATSAALYATAPVAVLAAVDDVAGQAPAAAAAERIGAPLLLTGPDNDPAGVGAELRRLGAGTVFAIGVGAARWATVTGGNTSAPTGGSPGGPGRIVTDERTLPPLTRSPSRPSVLVLTSDQPEQRAAAATARASGARVAAVPSADPRTWPPGSAPAPAERVVALGSAFGSAELLQRRFAVAAAGVQLPGGGQVAFPGRRLVALYGHPGAPALGVLGEQDLAASVTRAEALAAQYRPVVAEPVVPAFEIIATVADAGPGPDGDYSAEATVEFLRPWVDAASAAGMYVMLDLQPGRADFLTQAQRYQELLAEPNVGLALDPEWRLRPDQRHREQIGSVSVEELNAVIGWLAGLTRDHVLPQKLLMVHQFRTSMITGRERLDTSRDELSVLIHADGFGGPGEKFATWDALHLAEPAGIRWGWKNFYDEDRPLFMPAQTMAVGSTPPVFVSYQ